MLLIWKLLVSHAVMDYWAQSDALAKMKNRHNRWTPPPGQEFQTVWPYALTSHAMMHGLGVYIACGSLSVALAETVSHWAIDFGKCENWYGIHADQAMHIGCKVLWALLVSR
jgi:hypothetical protein